VGVVSSNIGAPDAAGRLARVRVTRRPRATALRARTRHAVRPCRAAAAFSTLRGAHASAVHVGFPGRGQPVSARRERARAPQAHRIPGTSHSFTRDVAARSIDARFRGRAGDGSARLRHAHSLVADRARAAHHAQAASFHATPGRTHLGRAAVRQRAVVRVALRGRAALRRRAHPSAAATIQSVHPRVHTAAPAGRQASVGVTARPHAPPCVALASHAVIVVATPPALATFGRACPSAVHVCLIRRRPPVHARRARAGSAATDGCARAHHALAGHVPADAAHTHFRCPAWRPSTTRRHAGALVAGRARAAGDPDTRPVDAQPCRAHLRGAAVGHRAVLRKTRAADTALGRRARRSTGTAVPLICRSADALGPARHQRCLTFGARRGPSRRAADSADEYGQRHQSYCRHLSSVAESNQR
jgi:hypothetical protein